MSRPGGTRSSSFAPHCNPAITASYSKSPRLIAPAPRAEKKSKRYWAASIHCCRTFFSLNRNLQRWFGILMSWANCRSYRSLQTSHGSPPLPSAWAMSNAACVAIFCARYRWTHLRRHWKRRKVANRSCDCENDKAVCTKKSNLCIFPTYISYFVGSGPGCGYSNFLPRPTHPEDPGPVGISAMLLGPSVSGILLTALIDGRAGLRDLLSRMCKWKVAPHWYAVLLIPPALVLATLFLLRLTISGRFSPNNFYIGILFGIPAGIFEEIGWT